ncbi:HET domain-containing protein [Fusarium keratoplasticum]|nr:HET domain-containing protein [Fusarium keratoplasticum]
MAMQSIDLDLYQIAVILPLKRDYETAARCLDQVFLRSSLQSTGAEYTLGRVGLHHVVLVTGLDNTSAADSVAVVYPDLLEAFSSIRVGFLVGVDAIAPYDGCAKAGDVVVGLPQSHESGIAHCDLGKSRDQKRLCITGNWGKPPGFVQSAVDHTLSYRCLPTCIFEAYLDQPDTLIDYEAFSYAWGNNEKSEAVIVDKRVLPVTENLHMALQHLRQEDIDRILWVDAVCIDQSNVAERGHQVTYMGSIYERANNVIVWLGSASEDAGLLISALNMLQHQTSSQAFRTAKRTDADWRYVWDKLQEKPSPSQRVRHLNSGLQELTGKSWFTRVWILQEVAKARRAQIHCTAGIVDTKLFALAPWLLRTHVPPQSQAILDIMPGPSRQSSWWSKERPLQELLWKFRECEATDPRDRVYALLGISSIADESIKPDYSKSERQVLRDVCDHLFGGLEAPVDLSLIYSIAQLQTELGILLLHEGVPLRKDTLATLLDPKLETDWGGMARTSLIAIRVGKDTLHLLFEHHGPGSSICRSILNEAILAGEETFSFSISSFNPAPERLKKFLYSSIPDTETLEELPISNVETLPEKLLASCF